MANLTSPADIQAAIGRPPADAAESARWGYYISSISAFVNNYVTDSFELLADDIVRLQADYYGIIELPGGPIVSVSSISEWDDPTQEVGYYYNGLAAVSGLNPLAVVNVTYTHGHDAIPLDVKYLVTDAIVSVLGLTGGTGALKSLTVGDVTETYADGTGAVVVQLSRFTLDAYTTTEYTMRLGGTPGFGSANTLPTL